MFKAIFISCKTVYIFSLIVVETCNFSKKKKVLFEKQQNFTALTKHQQCELVFHSYKIDVTALS